MADIKVKNDIIKHLHVESRTVSLFMFIPFFIVFIGKRETEEEESFEFGGAIRSSVRAFQALPQKLNRF